MPAVLKNKVVTGSGLPPNGTIDDKRATVLAKGEGTLHRWILSSLQEGAWPLYCPYQPGHRGIFSAGTHYFGPLQVNVLDCRAVHIELMHSGQRWRCSLPGEQYPRPQGSVKSVPEEILKDMRVIEPVLQVEPSTFVS